MTHHELQVLRGFSFLTIRDAKEAQVAAAALGRQLEVIPVGDERDVETAFTAMVQQKVSALAVDVAPFFRDRRQQFISLAARHGIPAIYEERPFAAAGGLMSYGANQEDNWRQGGVYVGRILKGEKPGDLPVQQSVKIDFVINLKTARALGLEVPPSLSASADEIIE